ncbi:hypothetical protein HWV62_27791 [Athelia sp. TMB]|nr:hypothetical protein HWV62_41779 [Athelia sp. TMB]KAF7969270.1 hypothetical protein HWV62_27791 [Athelia sp. TMB]
MHACGICQNGTTATWGEWTSNCSTVPLSYTYPETIPQNTSIPAWAYLSVNITGSFNVTAALADVSAPESSPPVQSTFSTSTTASAAAPTVTSQSAPISTSIVTVGPGPTQTPPAGAVSHKSNAGPIAGGVVGGLAGLAIVAGLIAYFMRRGHRDAASSVEPYGAKSQMTHTTNSPPPLSFQQQPYSPQPYKPYDPTDPSTYPPSAPTPTIQTSHSGYANGAPQPGRYSGMPEI